MNFAEYLHNNRRGRKPESSINNSEKLKNLVIKENISADNFSKISEIQPKNDGPAINKKTEHRKYLGEVSELPSASEFDEGTFIKKGQTIYIKQDGLWESLIEGSIVTREVVKYGVPGGGCGVSEVKQLISENASKITPYNNFYDLVSVFPAPVVGESGGIVAGGGYVIYTSGGWLGNIGVFQTLEEATSLTGLADGCSCTIASTGVVYVSKGVI